jgi:hypothetical protein
MKQTYDELTGERDKLKTQINNFNNDLVNLDISPDEIMAITVTIASLRIRYSQIQEELLTIQFGILKGR